MFHSGYILDMKLIIPHRELDVKSDRQWEKEGLLQIMTYLGKYGNETGLEGWIKTSVKLFETLTSAPSAEVK